MDHDYSDILGNPSMPVTRKQKSSWTGALFSFRSAFVLAMLFFLYIIALRIREHVQKWQERSYKLSMRRKHGIPDSDRRPFNVAYSDVLKARRENEAAKRSKRNEAQPISVPSRDQLAEQHIRYRPVTQQPVYAPQGVTAVPQTGYAPATNTLTAHPTHINGINGYHPNQTQQQQYIINSRRAPIMPLPQDVILQQPRPSRRASRKIFDMEIDADGKKRGFDEKDADEPEYYKKTRLVDDESVDIDQDAEWDDQLPKRGAKRTLNDEEDEIIADDSTDLKRMRSKRTRKVSLEEPARYHEVEDDMDIDEELDEVPELMESSRGKKRDRAEAGSTFGGDDEDSTSDRDHEDDKNRRRRRKRQTVSKRKSDAASSTRGKKRDRDLEGDSEIDNSFEQKASRKMRRKRASQDGSEERASDVSMDDSQTSTRSKNRQIGDEWEINGVKFKIGPNGQRLRQALVKKSRQKFIMPKDSQHPDVNANMEVFVETWLTEDEYNVAKSKQLLAWQDTPKPSVEPEKLSVNISRPEPAHSRASVGKNLLWGSNTPTPAASPVSSVDSPLSSSQSLTSSKDPYRRQSLAANANPFERPAASTTRRIASAATGRLSLSSSISGGLTDSTNGSPRNSRLFSKWEKQDLEAKAMMKMREASRKKEAEKEAQLKEERQKAEQEKAEKERAEKERKEKESFNSVPTITVTKPAETSFDPKPSFSFPPPAPDATRASNAAPSLFGPPPVVSTPSFAPPAPPPSLFGPSAPSIRPPSFLPSPFGNPLTTKSADAQSPIKAPAPPPNTFSFAPAPTPTSKPAENTFTAGSGGDNTSTKTASTPKPSPFSFAAPSSAPKNPTSSSNNAGANRPLTSFPQGTSGFGQKPESQPAAPASSTGSSLLSRISGAAQPASQSATSTTPSFAFAKPAAIDSAKSASSAFAAMGTHPQSSATPAPSSEGSGTSGGLKFKFGLPNKSSPGFAPAHVTSSSSSLSGALGGDLSKPGTTTFAFGAQAPATSTADKEAKDSASTGSTPSAANFGFGSGSSAFSVPKPADMSAASGQAQGDAPKPALSFGGNTATSSSAFGGPSTFGTSSAFGGGAASASKPAEPAKSIMAPPSVFGATSAFGSNNGTSTFGGATNTPQSSSSTSTPVFSFSNSSSTPTAPTTAETHKSPFAFGQTSTTPASTPTTGSAAAPSIFKFGDTGKQSTTPQASPFGGAPGQSMFDSKPAASSPAAFGFGTPAGTLNATSTPSTSSPFTFGASLSNGQQK